MSEQKPCWWERALDRHALERFDIARAGEGPYLTRWTLRGGRFAEGRKVFVHLFHRGDLDEACHDHPWPFWSLILAGGYYEHVPDPRSPDDPTRTVRRWFGRGSFLRRPAEWRHRVELATNTDGTLRRCWTLLWVGKKVRSWGFWCRGGWLPWREHLARHEATGSGCGDH